MERKNTEISNYFLLKGIWKAFKKNNIEPTTTMDGPEGKSISTDK